MVKKVSIIFCGGCNEHIDRGEIAQQLYQELSSLGYQVSFNCRDVEYLIYLSGCLTSCAYSYSASVKPNTAIAGETINALPVEEAKLVPQTVEQVQNYFIGREVSA